MSTMHNVTLRARNFIFTLFIFLSTYFVSAQAEVTRSGCATCRPADRILIQVNETCAAINVGIDQCCAELSSKVGCVEKIVPIKPDG